MRQILLAGLPPKTGEWLAYRLRGETVELLFSADDLTEHLQSERAPSWYRILTIMRLPLQIPMLRWAYQAWTGGRAR